MVSDRISAALEKAANRAARVAEGDAGLQDYPAPHHPSQKKSEALEKAKESSRSEKANPASDKSLEAKVRDLKMAQEGANEDSPAPTVPASDGSRKKRKSPKENGEKGDDAGSPTIVTPKPEIKIKRSDTAESAPKLSRHVQSRELMKRSPTLHYSPGEDRKPPKKVVKTAVKAKAKSGSSKEVKSKSKAAPKAAPRNPSPKLESPVPATADAVAHALTRQTTLELAPPSPGSDSESASSAEDAGCCKAAGAPSDPPGDDGGGCPKEIKAAGQSAHRCSEKLQVLFEQWMICDGHWKESSLYQQLKECWQYLVWDVDAEEDTTDTITSSFFEQIDKDDKGTKTKTNKKRKGRKAKAKGKKRTEETQEDKAKREQKELEAKAKEAKKKRIATANKVVSKLQSALAKASLVEVKAGGMWSAALKKVFLGELSPHKHLLGKKRDALLKVIDSVKGSGDLTLLATPESEGDDAVKDFLDFLQRDFPLEKTQNLAIQNAIEDVSSGASSIYKAVKRIRSHVQVPWQRAGFYGDAAQLITKVRYEKLLCLWLNVVIFRPKSIRYSRFLLWSCDVALLYKSRTLNTILRWLVWSFNCLYEGTYPMIRPGNRPLEPHEKDRAGTWITNKKLQFQVVELRGDWEFHKLVWQFKCSWKGGVNVGICYRCPAMVRARDPGLIYWNMDDENSTWAKEEFDTTDFICKRQMLCQELEYFGPGTFQQQLDKAYKDFVGFSRANKMDQSQPPFKEWKVPW
ncbi:unnamed protein product [Cladocopium goreaui]|uniref:Neurofilament heavy polypeptide n=1 Tax=Cladocopium goreaui TaxID=2562237 RepID=A0A9P1GN37_9DINO|nr:unnamed protein product [Cladocopium goreaui]